VAATLVVVCSVVAQVQTLPRVIHAIEWRRVLPFVVPGLVGVPVGTSLLASVDVPTFKILIGTVLVVFSTWTLLRPVSRPIAWGGRVADGAIGFGGGILGGLAGLSGPLPTIWASVRGWAKHERRSVFQAFNLTILCVALLAHVVAGLITRDLVVATATALPGTFAGAWLGGRLYDRVSDRMFSRILLLLLATSGVSLIWLNL
jgi:uncharacterized membrane protein YfcA